MTVPDKPEESDADFSDYPPPQRAFSWGGGILAVPGRTEKSGKAL
jgi:hypothetical protein